MDYNTWRAGVMFFGMSEGERLKMAFEAGRQAGALAMRERAANVCDKRVMTLHPTKTFSAYEVQRILQDSLETLGQNIRALKVEE